MLNDKTINDIRRAGNMFKALAEFGEALEDWLNQKGYLEEQAAGLEKDRQSLAQDREKLDADKTAALADVAQTKTDWENSIKGQRLESGRLKKAIAQAQSDLAEIEEQKASAEHGRTERLKEIQDELIDWEGKITAAQEQYQKVLDQIKALKATLPE